MQNFIRLSMAAVVASTVIGCATRDEDVVDAGKKDAGTQTDAGTPDAGGSDCAAPVTFDPTKMTVAQAVETRKSDYVEIDGAVVVAGNVYNGTGTYYIQDPTGGAGLAVYHGYKDETLLPEIGDVVTVKGRLTTFSGSLQIATSCGKGVFLSIEKTGTGTAMAGAMPPAGNPTVIANADVADFAHSNLSAHPELVGTVIQFDGPLTVTNKKPDGLVETVENDDGSTKTNGRGFEITGGIWVDDDLIYAACIKTLPDGTPDLTNGIRGIWERYNDFYGGTAANPAPTYSVLKPLNCADIALPAPTP